MLYDSIKLLEGSDIQNPVIASGSDLPLTNLDPGELFFRTADETLYIYSGSVWKPLGSSLAVQVVTGTSVTAEAGTHYVLTNTGAATTVTLPATPSPEQVLWISNFTGRVDCVVARNGSNIMQLAEDMMIDAPSVTVPLKYINVTIGWIIA